MQIQKKKKNVSRFHADDSSLTRNLHRVSRKYALILHVFSMTSCMLENLTRPVRTVVAIDLQPFVILCLRALACSLYNVNWSMQRCRATENMLIFKLSYANEENVNQSPCRVLALVGPSVFFFFILHFQDDNCRLSFSVYIYKTVSYVCPVGSPRFFIFAQYPSGLAVRALPAPVWVWFGSLCTRVRMIASPSGVNTEHRYVLVLGTTRITWNIVFLTSLLIGPSEYLWCFVRTWVRPPLCRLLDLQVFWFRSSRRPGVDNTLQCWTWILISAQSNVVKRIALGGRADEFPN